MSAVVAITLLAGTSVAVVSILLVQDFPSYPIVSGLSSTCVSPSDLTGNVTQIIAGTSGYIRYTCGSAAAFTAVAGATGTPRFNRTGTVFTKLYIFDHSTPVGTSCAGGLAAVELTTGQAINFPAAASTQWDYCARYVDAQLGMATSFNITWEA